MAAGDLFIWHSWVLQKKLWALPANTLILLPASLRGHGEFALLREAGDLKTVAEIFLGVWGNFINALSSCLLVCFSSVVGANEHMGTCVPWYNGKDNC